MPSPDFWHDPLTLVVIDKAVFAVVLVVVGFLVNRKLEAFKSHQALRAKMAEAQLQEIAKQMEVFSRTTRQADQCVVDLQSIALKNWYTRQNILLELERPLFTPLAITNRSRQLSVMPDTYAGMRDQAWEAARPERESRLADLGKARTEMRLQQFWLGSRLVELLERKYGEVMFRMQHSETAFTWLSLPRPKRKWALMPLRLHSWLVERSDQRTLKRLGLDTGRVTTDVNRMIDHVS